MKNIKSCRKENSIKVVAFAIHFSRIITNNEIKELAKQASNNKYMKDNFSAIKEDKRALISFNNPNQMNDDLFGIICRNSNWQIRVNKEMIVVTCYNYDTWCKEIETANEYILHIYNLLNTDIKFSRIVLEYLDEFEVLKSKSNWKTELFKKDNNFLSVNFYNSSGYCHINQGNFKNLDKLDEPLLNKIDIMYLNANGKDIVNIKMQHALNDKIIKDDIKKLFNIIHEHSKNLFKELINESILDCYK